MLAERVAGKEYLLGFNIMRDIMGKASSNHTQEVPNFEYNPATQFDLFYSPLDDLKSMLLNDLAGLTLTMKEIYENHSGDQLYLRKNYVSALTDLLNRGKIQTDRKPRKGTFADNIVVTFPNK